MALTIGHTSALEYIRRERWAAGAPLGSDLDPGASRELLGLTTARVATITRSAPSMTEVEDLLSSTLCGLSAPLHLTVGSARLRRAATCMVCHALSGPIARGSLVQVGRGVYASSPELCFLQMAQVFDLVELVVLGYELCGGYTRALTGQDVRKTPPVTSRVSLCSYISRVSRLRGSGLARRAAALVADKSASTRETALAVLLSFPRRLGGHALPLPQMNYRIDIAPQKDSRLAGHYYLGDLCWPDRKVVVEYDSDAYHTGADRIAHDSTRRNALTEAGWTPLTITTAQLNSRAELERAARQIERALGKQPLHHSHNYNWIQLNAELHHRVLGLS